MQETVVNRLFSESTVIAARQLSQTVPTPAGELTILHPLDFTVQAGEQLAITGRSGSGKSTLLGLLAGLDRASAGQVFLCGKALHDLDEDQRAAVRLAYIGFVFQSFQLLNHLSALDNVLLPLTLNKRVSYGQAKLRAEELLARVGLEKHMKQTPRVLSGGEQQRVAVARALINNPSIVFADEPTGNLDSTHARELHELFVRLRNEMNQTFLIVTHNEELAGMSDRVLHMRDGKII